MLRFCGTGKRQILLRFVPDMIKRNSSRGHNPDFPAWYSLQEKFASRASAFKIVPNYDSNEVVYLVVWASHGSVVFSHYQLLSGKISSFTRCFLGIRFNFVVIILLRAARIVIMFVVATLKIRARLRWELSQNVEFVTRSDFHFVKVKPEKCRNKFLGCTVIKTRKEAL